MSASNHTSLFGSLKRLGGVAVATVHDRVALFALELQEEKCRLVQAILLTAAAIALGVTALTLVTITVVVLFWESARVPVLCVLSGMFVFATFVVIRALTKRLTSTPGFSGTLGELQKDRACFLPPD